MAKYVGRIGIGHTVDKGYGVYEMVMEEHDIFGDFLQVPKSQLIAAGVNDDITISNRISIFQNSFVMNNLHDIKYLTYGGAKWKVSSVELNYPRIILTTGGLYNND